MATYTNIQGQNILIVSSDPANPTIGQIWYNTTSNTLKGYADVGAWVTGGNLATARNALAGAGTQTAGLAFGGDTGTPSTATEEYDGTSWTAGGNLGTARLLLGGCGTQTTAAAFGGTTSFPTAVPVLANTEEYNGTSWTAGGNLGTARSIVSGAGLQTSALAFGGVDSTPGITTAT
jgi:hypothetical protein